jgi:1-acyl-sn-glycerol-3-phosphate acyltransferase
VWRRRAFLKRPGLVTVSVGAPIDTRRLTPQELNRMVEDWIEGEVKRISNTGGKQEAVNSVR